MAVTAGVRLLVLTALVGLAGAALSARTTEPAHTQPAPPEPGNSPLALAVLIAIAVPALVLIVVAALRFRRTVRAAPRPAPRPARRWLGAIILLGLLALMVAGTVLAAGLARQEPPGPAPTPPTATPAPHPPSPAAGEERVWLLVAVAGLLVLLVLAAIAYRRSPSRPAQDPPEPALRRAVERALAAVTEPAADARAAIIRCYATMEGALSAAPGLAPRVADTPSEVLQRAHHAGAVRSASTWHLVELFDEARFSRHRMSEPDRADAEASLRVILDELGSSR